MSNTLTSRQAAEIVIQAWNRWSPTDEEDGEAEDCKLLDTIGSWLQQEFYVEEGDDGQMRLTDEGLLFAGLIPSSWSGPGWYVGRDQDGRRVLLEAATPEVVVRVGGAARVSHWSGPHLSSDDAAKVAL